MTLIEFFARTKPISRDDKRDMLSSITSLTASPFWDDPSTPSDRYRDHSFERARIMLSGMDLLQGKLVWRHFGPTIVVNGMDPQPLWMPRGGR